MARAIVLYRVPGHWLTDASIGAETGLSICSGDSQAEWYVKVAPSELTGLLAALEARRDGKPAAAVGDRNGAAPDVDEIMELLLALFGDGNENPFREIKQFLTESGIPWKADFWGSM